MLRRIVFGVPTSTSEAAGTLLLLGIVFWGGYGLLVLIFGGSFYALGTGVAFVTLAVVTAYRLGRHVGRHESS